MYLQHFKLKERPFTISPDPRFLFMSNRYREALAHLTYGVHEGGGFVLLTGEVGTGKTTVCRCLLQQLPDNTRLAFVLNPKLNSLELLATICDELKIEYPENCNSLKILTDKLSEFLLTSYKAGLNVVVMIDEAQNLETEVLEQIRLLTNLETNQKKLLQIILVGQPELQEKLAQRNLRQLAQRITARYHLRPLSLKETIAYVLHRVRIAGCTHSLFSRESIEHLHAKTMGIPRLVNTICDRALFAAASRSKNKVDKKIISQAITEVMGEPSDLKENQLVQTSWFNPKSLKMAVTAAAVLVLFGVAFWAGQQSSTNVSAALPNDAISKSVEQSSGQKEIGAQQEKVQPENSMGVNSNENLLNQLIGDQRWDNNGNWSMQALLALWQIDYSPLRDGNACDFAAGYGLKCANYQGQWQQLRDINRPAIIKLSAGLQGEFWGTLKSINGIEANLVFGDKESQISLAKLSTLWTGEFSVLWQVPPGFAESIKLGDQSEAVDWLWRNLNLLESSPNVGSDLSENNNPDRFDVKLKQRLIAFQQQRNLEADGIAGMQTILKINAETLKGIPLLSPL